MKKRKHYTDEFVPYTGFHFECSNNYIEVGRACYQHPELKKSKNDSNRQISLRIKRPPSQCLCIEMAACSSIMI